MTAACASDVAPVWQISAPSTYHVVPAGSIATP
jgi:hypothetical protein